MKNILLQTTENIIDFLKEKIPTEKTLIETETGIVLPDIVDYLKGYWDIFKLENYPSILVGFDKIEPESKNLFTEVTFDVVLVIMNEEIDLLNDYGLLYSDVLTNLFSENYRINENVLNTEIQEVNHYFSDDKYIIDITIKTEIEVNK